MATTKLHGLRLLVVEDESLVALMIEDMLEELGCIVAASAASLARALALAHSEKLDGALLDMNLAGQPVYPVAEILTDRRVPFIFATGYDRSTIDRRFAHVPVVHKPFDARELGRVLAMAIVGLGNRAQPA